MVRRHAIKTNYDCNSKRGAYATHNGREVRISGPRVTPGNVPRSVLITTTTTGRSANHLSKIPPVLTFATDARATLIIYAGKSSA